MKYNFNFLLQCEEDMQEKRTYLSPDEVIYAQPVDIKPIGKPIASIPVRGPPRHYGAPKPMPYPSRPQKIPPKRVGYGGNYRPGFSEKYGSNFQFSQSGSNGGLYGGHDSNYVTKPPTYGGDAPYAFDNTKPNYNKGPISQSSTKTETVVQQHVHHHYVHGDGDKDPKVIIKPVAIPVGSVGQLGSSGNYASQIQKEHAGEIITAGGADFSGISSGGFKPMTGGYLDNKPVYETDTIYGSQYGHDNFNNKGGANIYTQSLPKPYPGNGFEDHKFGNSLGAYATQNTEFYKKELNVGPSNNLYSQGPATFGQNNIYQGNYHEAKAQQLDCVCVNYDQCPSQEIIGRRDDLYLPIDPRNKGDIAALTDEQLDNITKSDASEVSEKKQNDTETDAKKISKRDVSDDNTTEAAKEIEPVSTTVTTKIIILMYLIPCHIINTYMNDVLIPIIITSIK